MTTEAGPRPEQPTFADERERDRAAESDAALVEYARTWERKLARLQRAHPQRWCVPGLSDEEVRDALTLRLIEAIRELPGRDLPPPRPGKPQRQEKPHREGRPHRPGKDWGLCVVEAHLSGLRRSFRLGATPTDFRCIPLPGRAPSQEEHWLELEQESCRVRAEQRAHAQLSRPQRRWLDALKSAAAEGAFFETSERLNLSAASRRLGMNRSSASRAYDALQACFARELQRSEQC